MTEEDTGEDTGIVQEPISDEDGQGDEDTPTVPIILPDPIPPEQDSTISSDA